jgi:hypothetical protein
MVYRGRVKNGVVVLEGRARPEEGTKVTVHAVRKAARTSRKKNSPLTLYERMRPFIGIAKGLPSDMSINHDHYLYGTPKRK